MFLPVSPVKPPPKTKVRMVSASFTSQTSTKNWSEVGFCQLHKSNLYQRLEWRWFLSASQVKPLSKTRVRIVSASFISQTSPRDWSEVGFCELHQSNLPQRLEWGWFLPASSVKPPPKTGMRMVSASFTSQTSTTDWSEDGVCQLYPIKPLIKETGVRMVSACLR